jgi:S-adenosylmethionine decarboxylase
MENKDPDAVGPCHFGEHLTLDGYGGDPARLDDKGLVSRCLNELPDRLGMSKLSEPQVYFANGNGCKDPGGWSGFVVIAESHISIHTFPARRFVSIDVYSCQNGMDVAFIESYFRDKFDLTEIETNFIHRGTKYPACNLM